MKIHRTLLMAAGTALLASTAAVAEQAQICGGMLGLACDEKHFCHYSMTAQCGAADQTGLCKPIPDMCASVIDTVCACNGETFNNECEANMKGVSVASKGACKSGGILGGGGILDGDGLFKPKPTEPAPTPAPATPATGTATSTTVCGGRGGPQCAAGYVCIYPKGSECGAADVPGECKATAGMMCSTEFAPVCGCDGETYSNACVAQYQHGVSVKAEGECPKDGGLLGGGGSILKPPTDVSGSDDSGSSSSGGGLFEPRKCGGASKRSCPLSQYCQLPEGSCTTANPNPEGTCAKAPLTCNEHTLPSVTQVCGCDGATYRTECHAQKAGVSVLYRGACFSKAAAAANEQANPKACGGKGLLARRCSADAGEFCEYEAGVCGLYDAAGSCTAKPEVCSAEVSPVCSCSGKSFTNACEARRAGESIKSLGNCQNVIHTIDDGIGGGGLGGGGLGGLGSGGKLDVLESNSTSGMCNPKEGMPCPEGYYCAFELGNCLVKQEMGLCMVQPQVCTPSSESTPVCGCSGSTFGTPCGAAMAGESLVSETSCMALSSPAAAGPVRGALLSVAVTVTAGALALAGLVV